MLRMPAQACERRRRGGGHLRSPPRDGSGPAANDEANPNNNSIRAEQATDTGSVLEISVSRQLELRGIGDTDYVSFNRIDDAGNWQAERVPAVMVPQLAMAYATMDCYVSVNPVRAVGRGRGGNADVTRLAALVCELDFDKLSPAACSSVITTISSIVGWPSMLVFSGGGVHCWWPVDGDDARGLDRSAASILAARFGLLVAVVARRHGGSVDTVSDLARVLRVVGTTNRKRSQAVKVVGFEIPRGCPVFIDDIIEALDDFGIEELTADEATREIVAPPSTWTYNPDQVEHNCSYLEMVRAGWFTDTPRPGQGRHKWLIYQSCRLHGFVRRGCIGSREQYEELRSQLRAAFHMRIAGAHGFTPREEMPRREFEAAIAYSIFRVSIKTDADVLSETGQLHAHNREANEAAELAALAKGVGTHDNN